MAIFYNWKTRCLGSEGCVSSPAVLHTKLNLCETFLMRVYWEQQFFPSVPSLLFGLPQWLSGKESICKAGDTGDLGYIPGSGRSPGGKHGNSLQYSCLENPMDREAWWAAVHGVTRVRHNWVHTHPHTYFLTHTMWLINASFPIIICKGCRTTLILSPEKAHFGMKMQCVCQ